MITRLADNLLSINGFKVFINNDTKKFYTFNGTKIGLLRLQALYLFIDNEERASFRNFSNKVDKLIKQLIYND